MSRVQMSEEERRMHESTINEMNHESMCREYRFAGPGRPYFTDLELYERFMARYRGFGGMTPEMSKRIGLEH